MGNWKWTEWNDFIGTSRIINSCIGGLSMRGVKCSTERDELRQREYKKWGEKAPTPDSNSQSVMKMSAICACFHLIMHALYRRHRRAMTEYRECCVRVSTIAIWSIIIHTVLWIVWTGNEDLLLFSQEQARKQLRIHTKSLRYVCLIYVQRLD